MPIKTFVRTFRFSLPYTYFCTFLYIFRQAYGLEVEKRHRPSVSSETVGLMHRERRNDVFSSSRLVHLGTSCMRKYSSQMREVLPLPWKFRGADDPLRFLLVDSAICRGNCLFFPHAAASLSSGTHHGSHEFLRCVGNPCYGNATACRIRRRERRAREERKRRGKAGIGSSSLEFGRGSVARAQPMWSSKFPSFGESKE